MHQFLYKSGYFFITKTMPVMLACVCSFSFAASAEPSQNLNLGRAFELAQEVDTQWRSARASIAAQRELKPQAKAALLPTVSTGASFFEVDSQTTAEDPLNSQDVDGTSKAVNVEVRQPLVNLSALKLYKSAGSTMDVLDLQMALAKQSLALRLSNAYFDLLLAQESSLLAKSELKAIERQLDQTNQRFRVGLVSKTDVLEAQAAFDLAQVAVALADNDVAISQENLSIIVGQPVVSVQNVKASIALEANQDTSNEYNSRVLSGNMDLKVAQLQSQIASLSLDAQKASYWPTVDFVASYADSSSNFDNTTTQYGVQASWVPFQGGGLRSRVRQAELSYQSALTDLTGLKQTLSRDAHNLHNTLATDLVRINAQNQAVKSSESALEATRAGYKVGTRNVVDVLNAQRAVFGAKRDFAQARYTWILNQLSALALEGKLSQESFAQMDRLLTSR